MICQLDSLDLRQWRRGFFHPLANVRSPLLIAGAPPTGIGAESISIISVWERVRSNSRAALAHIKLKFSRFSMESPVMDPLAGGLLPKYMLPCCICLSFLYLGAVEKQLGTWDPTTSTQTSIASNVCWHFGDLVAAWLLATGYMMMKYSSSGVVGCIFNDSDVR